jgi:hypothetical protein
MIRHLAVTLAVLSVLVAPGRAGESPLRIAAFQADITPPLGSPLCDNLLPPAQKIDDPLSARGIILLTAQKPIVLCAMDWVGVGNGGYDAFREALAKAAGTTRERVAVHCIHAHDAPGCDFLADAVARQHGLGDKLLDTAFARKAIQRVADAVHEATQKPLVVTHIGTGKAKVEKVASSRRILGPDGKVKYVRYSVTIEPWIRAAPEGLIDPYVQCLSFWDGDRPLVSITYYATHPQSYYGRGGVTCDFPGLARNQRDQEEPGTAHLHFNGASGNVTAGKYNDGAMANRAILAGRLAKGMKEAFAATTKVPVRASDVEWRVTGAALPLNKQYNIKTLEAQVADPKLTTRDRLRAARTLVWGRRCEKGEKLDITCLRVGPAYVLHMPGELFVEYQLAAQKMRPDNPVMMAAYGDYGCGYIGTAIAYTQGGYEMGPVTRVGPGSEEALMRAMRELLR